MALLVRICPRCRTPYPDNVGVCGEDGLPLIQRSTVEGAPRSEGMLVPGSRVGEYLVEKLEAQSGGGAVYSGRHTLLQTSVTFELLRRSLTQDGVALARCVADLYGVNAIGHPAAVRVCAVGELDDGQCYVVSERPDGPDLAQILAREAVRRAGEALPIIEQLCHLLGQVHAAGIVHGGVEPGQIVVLRSPPHPTIRVSGFGARHLDASMPGRAHLAPEVRQGTRADFRADIYAVGALLGRLVPFHEPLAPVIHQATADLPGDRHASAAALFEAVRAAVGEPAPWVLDLSARDPAASPVGHEFGFEGIVTVRSPLPGHALVPEAIEGGHAAAEHEVDHEPVTFRTPPRLLEMVVSGRGPEPVSPSALAPADSLGELADEELEADGPAVHLFEPADEPESLADTLDDLFEEEEHTDERAVPRAELVAGEGRPRPDETAREAPRSEDLDGEEPTHQASFDVVPMEAIPTNARPLGRVQRVQRRAADIAERDPSPAPVESCTAPEGSPYLSIEIDGEPDAGD